MAAKKKNPTPLPFSYKLVLNQWLISLFGFDPLAKHKEGKRAIRPIQALGNTFKNASEGLGPDNLHYFYKSLEASLQEDKAIISREELLHYERNIVSHTLAINENRDPQVTWKYFQWLSLLFTEIYLDRFFVNKDRLLDDINAYVERFNTYWEKKGYKTDITPYTINDLNKLCLQNATGSGKTLLMHVNFLQFRHYANNSHFKDDLTRSILITPNEGLSVQHAREMRYSGIDADRLLTDSGDLLSSSRNGLRQVDFTEITKLGNEDGPKTIATRNLGDQNLLLVDEGHRGMGNQEERGWFKSRERLSEKGFVFEYSATFKEAVAAANDKNIERSYAKSILFDYSYRYFYEDGYGKDYRIFNLPETYDQLKFSYLSACLLSFYQQLKLYEDHKISYAPYNLEKPLWVFVGSTVTGGSKNKAEKETLGDVAQILKFISNFLANANDSTAKLLEKILTSNGQSTGLMDNSGGDIFAGSFIYLRELMQKENWSAQDLFREILEKLFQNRAGGKLTMARIKGDPSEIILRVGQAETPFGLINVGDAASLANHIKDTGIHNLTIQETEFSDKLFGHVHLSSSPVNILLGSKKFVEGWDCWRVSTLGLMHVGKNEGSQIIQLFGRGVRLKGYDWSLKRSGFATPEHQPEHIQYLETLNVFGIEADFMDRFKKFLEEEDLPSNDHKSVYIVPLNVTYDFGKQLKVLRPRQKRSDGREYDFKRDGRIPEFGNIPEKLHNKQIKIDWYPRIRALTSKANYRSAIKEETVFKDHHLSFLDYDDIYFRLEKFKRERAWHNFNIKKSAIDQLLRDTTWYKLIVPSGQMKRTDIFNIRLWQEMACELLQHYCDEYYKYCKAAFIQPRLELRILQQEDSNMPREDEYKLIIDSKEEALIQDIFTLQHEMVTNKPGIIHANDLKACFLSNHLYQPLMHVTKGSKIQIKPSSLNESEFQFVEDLKQYLENNNESLQKSDTEIYLLRNESRGKGIGFFEAGNFYPDFLLWKVEKDMQKIAFIEPHGLQHEGPGHKKIEFHSIIKDIEKRLNDPKTTLNSFIITPTRFEDLHWGISIENLAEKNVFFMNEQKNTYIKNIITKMN